MSNRRKILTFRLGTVLPGGDCLFLFVQPKENAAGAQRKNKCTDIDRPPAANIRDEPNRGDCRRNDCNGFIGLLFHVRLLLCQMPILFAPLHHEVYQKKARKTTGNAGGTEYFSPGRLWTGSYLRKKPPAGFERSGGLLGGVGGESGRAS